MAAPEGLKIYVTDHHHSQVVCAAIAQGSGGKIVPSIRLQDGPACVYGVLRGCGEIIRECFWLGRDFYHVDHGYMNRGHYHGYYRISKNDLQWHNSRTPFNGDSKRFESLGITLKPWRKDGRKIVVCPMAVALGRVYGIDTRSWLETVIEDLKRYTRRPVIIKPKDSDISLLETLQDAWALVCFSSNAAVDALIQGVPVFVLGPSAVRGISYSTLESIEDPLMNDRLQWFYNLANNQWTLEEIRSGLPWQAL